MLEVARRATVEGSPVGIELLFTVAEENGLRGAAHFDAAQLRSEFGYVFDHATPIGEVVTASPSYYRVGAEFHGRAAHAGIRPEEGRSAILALARAVVRDAARAGSTPRRPRTSARSPAASAPPTSSPSARGCWPRPARSTPTRPRAPSRA